MNKIAGRGIVVSLFIAAWTWWASVSVREAAAMGEGGDAPAPSRDPAVIEAVRRVERDMGDAMVAVEVDKLNQIFADDWATIGSSGRIITKEKILQGNKSGKDKLVSYENGPIEMDLLEKRSGKWVVVRSASASVK